MCSIQEHLYLQAKAFNVEMYFCSQQADLIVLPKSFLWPSRQVFDILQSRRTRILSSSPSPSYWLSNGLVHFAESCKDTTTCECGWPHVGSSSIWDKSTWLFALQGSYGGESKNKGLEASWEQGGKCARADFKISSSVSFSELSIDSKSIQPSQLCYWLSESVLPLRQSSKIKRSE